MGFVCGPRQVGKTTLVKHLLSKNGEAAGYFNWDIESHRRALIKNPEDFWHGLSLSTPHPRIALDEIHKYPRWKRFLKGLYDAHREKLEILVTGSGRLDVYQRGGDSLFGRYALHHLHPFTLGEFLTSAAPPITSVESLWNQALHRSYTPQQEEGVLALERFSGFPEPLFAGSEQRLFKWRKAHRDLIIREDLRDLTRIRDIGLIEHLVMLLPERVGSPLSLNALREDLNVAFGTVRTWIEALSRLYYLFQIRPYSGKLARTLHKETKVYLFDFTEIEDRGARFENMVALHLSKLCDWWTDSGFGDYELWYVRDKEKREVDFLITERRRPMLLVEAKLSGDDISPSLSYFYERLRPRFAMQLVRNPAKKEPVLISDHIASLPAATVLSLL